MSRSGWDAASSPRCVRTHARPYARTRGRSGLAGLLALVLAAGCGAALPERAAVPVESVVLVPVTPGPVAPRASAPARPAASPTAVPALAAPVCARAVTMPLRAALAQTLMVGVRNPSRAQLRGLLGGSAPLGGLFMHGDSARVLTDGRLAAADRASVRPLIAADDEGGRVQRIEFAYSIPSAREQARTMSPAEVRALAERRGRALLRYGVTMDLAPTVDVSSQPDGAVIGDRSFSGDPKRVARYAGAFADGLRAAGVLPTLKHFPGHGRARGDSHLGAARTPRVGSLRAIDWSPYRALVGPGVAVMMGHLQVPGLSTRGLPASLDPALYRALRQEIGFTGLVVTDELASMRAIRDRYGVRAAVRRSIAAGADLALIIVPADRVRPLLADLMADVRAGRLPEQRVRTAAGQVLAAKGCPPATS